MGYTSDEGIPFFTESFDDALLDQMMNEWFHAGPQAASRSAAFLLSSSGSSDII